MYDEILATDRRSIGIGKLHTMFTELYALTTVSISSATALTSAAFGKIHNCSGTAANYTIDLPTAVGNSGQSIVFKGLPALTKVVTLQGVSTEKIDGEPVRQIGAKGMISIMSDGSDWVVMDEVGSWINYTPVLTGWLSDPIIDRSEYYRVGKMVTVQIHTNTNGTSNNGEKMFTVPFNAAAPTQLGLVSLLVDGGVALTSPGGIETRVGSLIVDVYNNTAHSASWSGGDTGCRISFTLRYIIE